LKADHGKDGPEQSEQRDYPYQTKRFEKSSNACTNPATMLISF
jgi:hypothetical protein